MAAGLGALGALAAMAWLAPSWGANTAKDIACMWSAAAGIFCTIASVCLALRKIFKDETHSSQTSRKGLGTRGSCREAMLKHASSALAHKAVCCLMAFLLSFSLLGDGLVAYADELHSQDSSNLVVEESEGEQGAGSESENLSDIGSQKDEPVDKSKDENVPNSPDADLAKESESEPAADKADPADADNGPDPYEILNAPVSYYDDPEPEGDLVSTENGVTVYQISGDTYRTIIGGVATAYVDDQGEAQPIDNQLVPKEEQSNPLAEIASLFEGEEASSADAPPTLLIDEDGTPSGEAVSSSTVYEPVANECEIAIPAVMGEDGLVIAKEGHEIRLVPEQQSLSGSVVEGNAIRYTDVLPGVDYQYTFIGSLVKEDIVLTRPVEPFRIATRIETDAGATVAQEGGTIVVRAKDEDGKPAEELISLAAPLAIDAAEAIDNTISLSLEEAEDGAPLAVVNVNWDWLAADERAYPIRIDPAIDISSTAMRLTSVEQLAPTTYIGENNYQYAGYDDGDATGTGAYRGGIGFGMTRVYLDIRYDFGTIMDEAVIKRADLMLHQRTAYSRGRTQFGLYRNKKDWTFDYITWNTQSSMTHEFVQTRNANASKGYVTWDVREPVNNWVQGIWSQQGLCVKAIDERNMQCELFDHRYTDNPPKLEIDWQIPDPVSESIGLNGTTINLRAVTEADFAGKLQLDGVFADGVAQPRSMVAYELVGKGDAGVAYASRSYKYPDSSEWEKAVPNGTKYRDKLSNWQTKLFGGLSYNTSYKIRARAAAGGASGKLVESDSFLVYRATAKDTLPSIASHYGVTLDTLARDNRVQDTLVVGGNTIFVRNPKTTAAYNPKQLTDTQKRRIDSALMGRGKHCEYGFEPINLNTGNFILEAVDATVPDYGGDFSINRTYNAQGDGYQSALGATGALHGRKASACRLMALSFTPRVMARSFGSTPTERAVSKPMPKRG